MKKLIIGLLVLFLLLMPVACAKETAPTPTPAPSPTPTPASAPAPRPAPPPPFQGSVVPEEAHYLPGERVEVKFTLTNVSSDPITLDTYPPEMQVKPTRQEGIEFSIAAGTQPLEISPNDTITLEFTWDQKDAEGKQVSPGWYDVIFNDITIMQGSGHSYGLSPRGRVLIQYPQGAMEKTIELDQSRTANDITVTLESIELTATGMTAYAFGTLPGYASPSGPLATSPFMHVFAEYSVDGGIVKQAGSAGMQYLENGTRFIWNRYVDPVPSDAKELIFRISTITLSFAPDKPDELVGSWEFKVPLE